MRTKQIMAVIPMLWCMVLWEGYALDQYIHITNAYEFNGGVLEEWKSPGKYSPINMFDNDIRTCFAEGNDSDEFILDIQLEKPVTCDQMQILGGVALNDDLFMKNNRPRSVCIYLYESDKAMINDKVLLEKYVILEDKKEYQTIDFEKPYTFKWFSVQVLKTYKGTQYDDTCVTELKLYYKGEEIPVKDIDKMRKTYAKRIEERLRAFLQQRKFSVSEGLCDAVIDSNGYITWKNYSEIYWKYYKDQTVLLTRIYVKGPQLYVIYNGKEYVAQYKLRYYSLKPDPPLTPSLGIYNIAGIEKNNFGFMKKWKEAEEAGY